MYNTLITQLAERSFDAAIKRGFDPQPLECLRSLAIEQREYWKAIDEERFTDALAIIEAERITYDQEFVDYYSQHLHNTTLDELADIALVAATWREAARLAEGEECQIDRTIDALIQRGAIHFVEGQSPSRELMIRIIKQKLRYNELRKD